MSIVVTGGGGYIGWPTSLRIANRADDRVVLVDNFARGDWVEEVGSVSATPVADIDERLAAAREVHDPHDLSFVEGDHTDEEA
jgi:nucleoside-diphosphate-sugar epimerase